MFTNYNLPICIHRAGEDQAKLRKKLGIDEDSDEILKHSKK